MKNNNEVKSFTFKVAEESQTKNKQFKAQEGVAIAGCTNTKTPWGYEPTFNMMHLSGDGSFWC